MSQQPQQAARGFHSAGGAASAGSGVPVPAGPTPPAARPLRPGAAAFPRAPSAEGGEAGWARGRRRGEGRASGQGRGREAGRRQDAGRRRERRKENVPGWEKSDGRAGRRHGSRSPGDGDSAPADWRAPLPAQEPPRLRGRQRAQRRVLDGSGRAVRPGGRGRGRARGPGDARPPPRRPLQPRGEDPAGTRGDAPPTPPQTRAAADTARPRPPPPTRNWTRGRGCRGNFWG